MSVFEVAIPVILKHEGGWVNDKDDPGGATNWGVSLRWLKTLGELEADIDGDGDIDTDDIRGMPKEYAVRLYRKYWWNKYRYERINDQALATKVFDLSINMGAKQCHKLLQRTCNKISGDLEIDGILGIVSFNVISSLDPRWLLAQFKLQAIDFYKSLNKPKYINGWIARVKD